MAACDGSIRFWNLQSGQQASEPEFTDLEEPLRLVVVAPGLGCRR